jgi:hypothetical protein
MLSNIKDCFFHVHFKHLNANVCMRLYCMYVYVCMHVFHNQNYSQIHTIPTHISNTHNTYQYWWYIHIHQHTYIMHISYNTYNAYTYIRYIQYMQYIQILAYTYTYVCTHMYMRVSRIYIHIHTICMLHRIHTHLFTYIYIPIKYTIHT